MIAVFAMPEPFPFDTFRLFVHIDIQTNFVSFEMMSEAKKSKILTAARSVFLRYGYRRVNMNDIAEAAGLSRPALYILF